MLSFRLEYPVTPLIRYNLQSGLVNKPRAYHFNFPTGGSKGAYHFDYDRRDEILIEKEGVPPLVKWGTDLHIEEYKPFQSLVAKVGDIEIEKDNILDFKKLKEINNQLDSIIDLIYTKSDLNIEAPDRSLEFLEEQYIHIDKDLILTWRRLLKEMLIDSKDSFLNYNDHEIYCNLKEFLINRRYSKELNIEKDTYLLSYGIHTIGLLGKQLELVYVAKDVGATSLITDIRLEHSKDSIEYEDSNDTKLEYSNRSIEHEYSEDIKINYTPKGLLQEEDIITVIRANKDLYLDNLEKLISAMSPKDLWIELNDILLNIRGTSDPEDNPKEIELLGDCFALHKKLRELNRENKDVTMRTRINELAMINWEYLLELAQRNLTINIDFILELLTDYETLIFKHIKLDTTEKDIDIEKDENALNKLPQAELYIEHTEDMLEELVEFLVEIEEQEQKVDLVRTWQVLIEKYEDLLEMPLIPIFNIYIKNWEQLLEKIISQYATLENIEDMLKKSPQVENIVITKDKKFKKGYQEVTTEKWDNDLSRTFIGDLTIEKSEEYEKVKRELDLIDDEPKVQFYKRFWFLRATEPRDWKVLPEVDYPYETEPLDFGSSKGVPENWQLEMIPDYSKEVTKHPIVEGSNWGLKEMDISIEIMIDMINIAILLWARMYYNFSGYTGSQAMYRFMKIIYDWFILETSQEAMEEKGSKEHYYRVYRWMRWEAEKTILKAKDDMDLNGNMYIEDFLWELIYYMENHHFDTMPLFDLCDWMDEYRNTLSTDEPQGDIKFVLDKVKGMRHKIIEGRVKKNNE